LNPDPLKKYLKKAGATLIGIGDVTEALTPDIAHLKSGIAIAVRKGLNADTVKDLMNLQKLTERWLKKRGFRYLSIPPDSDRRNGKFVSRLYELFSHKTAATCSGLGWIGKNGLIINHEYGPKLSWATVLTDAPIETATPVTGSLCGDCDLCIRYCPSQALTGHEWTLDEPFHEIVKYKKCRSLKKERRLFDEKPNCGVCINICPYARNEIKEAHCVASA
jgi:epoxyqueuosine reductase QueG